ncbi:MAG: DsbA family protein [Deltaproteobacteria bacterium]|nr:DsbA family protein [Deltaproteobacteria bacterium]
MSKDRLAPITFYFDFISPYSYLASALLARRPELLALPIDPRPVVFGSILSHRGVKGPGEIPSRRRAAVVDALLCAERYGIPFEGPPAHPFNSLWALRSVAAIDDAPLRRKLAAAYFHAAWALGESLEDLSVLRRVLSECGIEQDPEDVATRREIRQRTKAETKAAIARGVWGVPTFVVDDVLFFGHDRLDLLLDYVSGRAALDRAKVESLLGRPGPISVEG